MRIKAFSILATGLGAMLAPALSSAQDGSAGLEPHQDTVSNYCFECHNFSDFEGGLALDLLDMSNVEEDAETWEKVVNKLRGSFMPPPGQPRPDEESYDGLRHWLEDELDAAYYEEPNAGRPGLYRLNRTEYATVIEDIFGLEVSSDVEAMLPPDNTSYGFDNIADLMTVSPTLLESYLAAADRVSALAVADPDIAPEQTVYSASAYSQDQHIEGLPLGTRGGIKINHHFPADGVYEINTSFLGNSLDALRGLQFQHQFEVSVDGRRARLISIGGNADYARVLENAAAAKETIENRAQVRLPLTAGEHEVVVTFLAKTNAVQVDQLEPFDRDNFDPVYIGGTPSVDQVQIQGPFNARPPSGTTESREKIFSCYPSSVSEEMRCAEQILSDLARQAYRRPVENNEVNELLDFFQEGREAKGTFDGGIQMGIRRILMSPNFLFRFEDEPEGVAPGENFEINDLELASRLSFFIWSSVPDEELLRVAEAGRLSDPQVLDQQIDRMLEDPKSRALVDNFAGQWLQLRNLASRTPDQREFPNFDENLRQGFYKETAMFFEHVIRQDRPITELMTADYTFLNDRLATHYGIEGINGSHFRRVELEDERRGGLLSHGSVLTVTSYPNRTSPVVRGKYILDNILGTPPADPPDDVPALDENDPNSMQIETMRERLARHREDPACASCHNVMDPLGLAMEKYDGIGRWRDREDGLPIDSSGELASGAEVNGPQELVSALMEDEEMFVHTAVEKMLTYAIGRGLEYYDMPVVRSIVDRTADDDYRFSALVKEVAKSMPFQMKRAAGDSEQLSTAGNE